MSKPLKTVADLWAERQLARYYREREARLATCGLLPVLLVYLIHLAW